MILYCLRHGQSEKNILRVMNEDPKKQYSLTDLGKEQAQEASEKLKDKKIDLIISSEFPRAIETAKIINANHNTKIEISKELNEINSGFEGKNPKEWLDHISSDPLNGKKPGFESIKECIDRICRLIESLKNRSEKEIVIVSHGTPTEAIRHYFKDVNMEKHPLRAPKTAEIFEFNLD